MDVSLLREGVPNTDPKTFILFFFYQLFLHKKYFRKQEETYLFDQLLSNINSKLQSTTIIELNLLSFSNYVMNFGQKAINAKLDIIQNDLTKE